MAQLGFLDIHCHILPGLDEGASSVEESVAMMKIAGKDGIQGIVATPHIMDGVYNNTREGILHTLSSLQERAGHPALFIGAEVRITRDLVHRISGGVIPLINDRKYLLLELPTYALPPIEVLEGFIDDLASQQIPAIISHPERNVPLLNNISLMERLIRRGAYFQVTAMSITGGFGKDVRKAVVTMIRKGYVHIVASDAHDATGRPPLLSAAYKVIDREFGPATAERLFSVNPSGVIHGEPILS